jgi:hypothetical protein
LTQQPNGRALILNLMLGNQAENGETVENLPNRLGMIFPKQTLDSGANVFDLGLGTAVPFVGFYVSSYINGRRRGSWLGRRRNVGACKYLVKEINGSVDVIEGIEFHDPVS